MIKTKIHEITEADITFVSLVGKGANGKDFLIVKSAEGEPAVTRRAPIVKIDDGKRLVTGVVYEPDALDSQGEFMRADAIEKAAHGFLANYRNIDKAHAFVAENAQVVESYVAKSDHAVGEAVVKAGSWVLTTRIDDDATWEQVKKGEINAYSMGGTGSRVERSGLPAAEPAPLVEKAEAAVADRADFAAYMDAKRIGAAVEDARWALGDVLREILADTGISDKPAAVAAQLDAFKAYVLSLGADGAVEKADALCADSIYKSERKISGKNRGALQSIYDSLGTLIKEFADDTREGDGAGAADGVAKAEGGDAPAATAASFVSSEGFEKTVREAIDAAVAKALEPTLKARGLASNLNAQASVAKTDRHYLAGFL